MRCATTCVAQNHLEDCSPHHSPPPTLDRSSAPFLCVPQAVSALDSDHGTHSGASAEMPAQQPTAALSETLAAGATASDELLLRELAVSLAERFVPLLTAIAQGAAPPPPRDALPLPKTDTTSGGGVGGAAGGSAYGAGTSATTAAAVAAASTPDGFPKPARTAAAARPTTLTGFAAECALELTSVAALVASSSPWPAAAGGSAAAPAAGSGSAAAPLFGANGTPGNDNCETATAAAATSSHPNVERPRGGSAGEASASENAGTAVKAAKDVAIALAGGEEAPTRRRALSVLSALLPTSTVPLLRLAEAWLGGWAAGAPATAAPAAAAATSGTAGAAEFAVSWNEDGGGIEAGSSGAGPETATAGSNGGAAVAGGVGEKAKGLAAAAVGDLAALVVGGVDMSRALRERHVERTRVLQRDGLEGERGGRFAVLPP